MNKNSSQITNKYDNISVSNPSLITAGLPSGSIMTARLIKPSTIIKPNHHLNQNHATDTQPITLPSENNDNSQTTTTLSYRTISDTYLNLSRKDIDDVMTALHTLAYHIQNSIDDNESHTLKNSYHHCSRYSLSSDHHVTKRMYRYPVEEFQHDLYDMKRKQERHRILRQLEYYQNSSTYPSHSSNALLYTSTCKIPLENQHKLSSYILDKFIYIDQNPPISNIKMLPEQVHTLQILQNNNIHNLTSTDSLNTKNILHTVLKPCYAEKLNNNHKIFDMNDRLNSNKIDVATQWSLQVLKSECNEMDVIKSDASLIYQNDQENATILTELSQSIKTIASNNSTTNKPLLSKVHSIVNNTPLINDLSNSDQINNQSNLTKSETEQFLTIFNIPTCKCTTKKSQIMNTNIQNLAVDDSISLDNDLSLDKKKRKQTSIKYNSKRSRHHTSKSSRNNQTIKRSRLLHRPSQSNNRLMTVIQSYKTIDPKEDSSFDFFDIDTTFSDTYDRLFTYTTTSENSS